MNVEPGTNRSDFDNPAHYRIVVNGCIPVEWSDRLEGMSITEAPPDSLQPVVVLQGELIDQCALAGVLTTLYELHLAVILVERLNQAIVPTE